MAKGKVDWTNPPQNTGKIVRTDDGTNNEYPYNINAGDTVGGYVPQVGDLVTFNNIETPARHATGVQKEVVSPTCTLTANPTDIQQGQTSTLSWTSTNADTLTLDNRIGPVTPVAAGSITVSPILNTLYTITATNSTGQSASDSVSVNVASVPTPP